MQIKAQITFTLLCVALLFFLPKNPIQADNAKMSATCGFVFFSNDSIAPCIEAHDSIAEIEIEGTPIPHFASENPYISLTFNNIGNATLDAPYHITLFKNGFGEEIIKIDTFNENIAPNSSVTKNIFLDFDEICDGSVSSIVVVVNCNGAGIAQNGELQQECDVSNNIGNVSITEHDAIISGPTYICEGETDTLTCSEADQYLWNNGATTQSISVSGNGTYSVIAYYNDGCPSTSPNHNTFVPDNPIIGSYLDDMIAGHEYEATAGEDTDNNLQLSHSSAVKVVNDTVFLPDGKDCGEGCSYLAHFTFEGFNDTTTITDVEQIYYLRLNLEHSYIGDLYINLSCPNGQNATILKKAASTGWSDCLSEIPNTAIGWQSGSNKKDAFFGNAFDHHDVSNYCDPTLYLNKPGNGWNYCWSNNTSQGYQYANSDGSLIYRSANVHNGKVDSSNVQNGTQFYHPDESFEQLVGCPINGTWTVEVIDGLSNDNGYIFECEIAIDDILFPTHILPIETITMSEPWTTQTSDSTFQINPPYSLQGDTVVNYTFTVTDINGCSFDDTVAVNIFANKFSDLYDTIHSTSLPFTWNGEIFTSAGSKTTLNQTQNGADSITTLHLSVIYTFDTAICKNNFPLVWHNITFNNESSVTESFPSDGADSINVYNVTSLDTNYTIFHKTICYDELPYEWMNEIFYETSSKTLNFSNIYECDSIVELNLSVAYPTGENLDVSVLENNLPFTINGESYDTPGIYTQHLVNHNGCDSVLNINLIIKYNSHTEIDSFLCANKLPIVWNGLTFNEAGTKTKTFTAANGADSIVVMHLNLLPVPEASMSGLFAICNGQETVITANESAHYLWSTNDTTQSITVTNPGIYEVTVTNSNGCSDTAMRNIMKVVVSPIAKTNLSDICVGDEGIITIGTDTSSTIVLSSHETTLSHTETIFLPDGIDCPPQGCSYQSPLTFTSFDDNATIQSVDDIFYVKLNMEHSYAGDLYINITCPNGQKADILKFNGTANSECSSLIPYSSRTWQSGANAPMSTFFGMAYDMSDSYNLCNANSSSNAPGIGWNYCWSNNTTENYQYAPGEGSLIYRQTNAHFYPNDFYNWWLDEETVRVFDSSNVAAGTQFYHPDESFSSLIGCPLNGSWYIEVMDGYSHDNGYVFGWELALAPHLLPVQYTDVTHTTVDGPWITAMTDSTFVVNVPADLPNDTIVSYTFHCFDDNGCGYDTILKYQFYTADSLFSQHTDCDSYIWNGITYTESGIYKHHYNNINGCDSLMVLELTINHSSTSSDSITLVENQLPYHFIPSDTVFGINSPEEFQFTYKLATSADCDSIINQKVIIYQNTNQSFDTTVCAYDFPLTWHGHQFAMPGTFQDSSLNENGSTNYMVFNILTDNLNILNSVITHVICYGEATGSATMNVSGGEPPYIYTWTNEGGATISSTVSVYNVAAGNYNFTITDGLGCVASNNIVVNTLNEEVQPGHIAPSQTICLGNQLAPFTGGVAGTSGNYEWQISSDGEEWAAAPGNSGLQNYTYPDAPPAGSYLLRRAWISSACGTFYSDTINIAVISHVHDTITDIVCQNSEYNQNDFMVSAQQTAEIGVIELTNTVTSGLCDSITTLLLTVQPIYNSTIEETACEGNDYNNHGFSIPAGQLVGQPEYEEIRNFTTISGCDSVVTLKLSIVDTSLKLINHTDDFCENMQAELSIETDMPNYIWSTGETTPNITATHSGYYSVTASQGDCENSKFVLIEDCHWEINMPNAITPSKNDGLNDIFCLPDAIAEQMSECEISIYDRWGMQVFYSANKNFRWDGAVNDKIMTNVVYNYIIRYKRLNGKPEIIKGSITIL